jgi:S-sulfosulfanyl-L-cysteine sulfohydrolase
MQRREFMQVMGAAATVASAHGLSLSNPALAQASAAEVFYDAPRFGQVHFLHFTDCHAQLQPVYFREPSVNLGLAGAQGKLPHVVGEHLLKALSIPAGSAAAHAFTHLNFTQAAQQFGKIGGFAHLATLVKRMKASRPNALLLDGGDTWQGSATALWTKGQDMVDACKLLGVNLMTAHWEFTLGDKRVQEIVDKDFAGQIEMLGQNVKTADFGDPVFKPYVMREMNGIPVAIIGQCFPYTPIANPRYFTPDWTFGIQEEAMQKVVDEARSKGAQVVVLLSHNGMDVDIKLASRVTGIDAILGGHTHDGVPVPVKVSNKSGVTLVTNAGSSSKYLGVLDFDVKAGKVSDFRYKLMPIFANWLPADAAMQTHIDKVRAPYAAKLSEKLTISDSLLYRRGNFNGSWDQLILDGLMSEKNTDIAFSPGFRWGSTILPGQTITTEHLMDQTAISYPYTTVSSLTGETIKTILEDVADNLFNPDPYYQQGGDMVRVGGLTYTCTPNESAGKRISNMRLKGELLDASKTYKVAGWAPVADTPEAKAGEPIWDLMSRYLKRQGSVSVTAVNTPELKGVDGNVGRAG